MAGAHPIKVLCRRRDRAAELFENFEMQACGLDEEFSFHPAHEVVLRHVPFYGWELDSLPSTPLAPHRTQQEHPGAHRNMGGRLREFLFAVQVIHRRNGRRGNTNGREDHLMAQRIEFGIAFAKAAHSCLYAPYAGLDEKFPQLRGQTQVLHDQLVAGGDHKFRPVPLFAKEELLDVGANAFHGPDRWIQERAEARQKQKRSLQ